MKKRLGTAVAALALAVTASFTPTAGWAASPEDDWLPEIADSATLSAPTVLSGTIETADGKPFAAGTYVTLYAYPAFEVTTALEVGDSVVATPVAKATIGEGGTFTLRIADAAGLARYASKTGGIEFELRAVDEAAYAPYSFSRNLIEVDGTAALVLASTAQVGGEQLRSELERGLDPVEIVSLADNTAIVAAGADTDVVNKTDVCGETLVTNLGSRQVTVGGTYTTATGLNAEFTYTSGASSTLGVGYSVSGSYGSFSASGSVALSSSSSVGFGVRSGSYTYATYYRYGKYSQWCYPVGQPQNTIIYAYKAKANQFDGGSVVTASAAPSATYCSSFAAGTTLTKNSSTAYTWSSGASLSTAIGVNLSSQTGYTSSAKLVYKNTGTVGRQICGTNGTWGSTPGRVVSKAWKPFPRSPVRSWSQS